MLVGYIRASLDADPQSISQQRDALIAAGVDPEHLFEDKALSPKADCAGLDECLGLLGAGDTLVVSTLDRLGHTMSHLLRTVEELHQRNIAFRSLSEEIDTGTDRGELLYSVFGALARYERVNTRERILARILAAEPPNRAGGRRRVIDRPTLEEILLALDQGISKAAICRTFGIARSTLYETLGRIGWIGPHSPC